MKKIQFLISLLVLSVVGFISIVFAIPPDSPYNSGETTNPACVPGTQNCNVSFSGGKFIDGTDSSEAVYSGNVGIGTTNPAYRLEVEGGQTHFKDSLLLDYGVNNGHTKGLKIGPYMEIGNTDTGRYPYMSFNAHMVDGVHPNSVQYAPTHAPGTGMVLNPGAGQGNLTFYGIDWNGDSTPKALSSFKKLLTIRVDGKIGINREYPSSDLHIAGGDTADLILETGTGTNYKQTFRNIQGSSLNWMWGDTDEEDKYLHLSLAGGQNRFNNRNRDFIFRSDAVNPIMFLDASSGNVGIGTNLPDNKLTVNGNFNVRDADSPTKSYRFRTSGSALDLDAAGAGLYLSTYPNADFSGIQRLYLIMAHDWDSAKAFRRWSWSDSGWGENIIFDSNGKTTFNEQGNSVDMRVEGDTDQNLFFVDGSADKIGIGTDNPLEKLDVNGNIRIASGSDVCIAGGNCLSTAGGGGASEINDLSDAISTTSSVFVGSGAGGGGTSNNNAAFGISAMNAMTTGSFNSAFGMQALQHLNGNSNTALGAAAGRNIADYSNLTSGSGLVLLGALTKPLSNADSNEIVIGINATGNGSNTVTLGNDSITHTYLKGDVTVPSGNDICIAGGNCLSTSISDRYLLSVGGTGGNHIIGSGNKIYFNTTLAQRGSGGSYSSGSGEWTASRSMYIRVDLQVFLNNSGSRRVGIALNGTQTGAYVSYGDSGTAGSATAIFHVNSGDKISIVAWQEAIVYLDGRHTTLNITEI